MKIPDLTELALRNLRESLLRNSLTTVGISVGVASLVAMVSLGIGLQQSVSRRLVKSGLFDTVVVTSRRDLRGMGREEERKGPIPGESRVLDESARLEIERLPNVLEAYPDIRFITELRYEDKPHLTMISALPQSAKSNDAFDGLQGNFFSTDTGAEVILQKSFAEELLGKTPPLGAAEPSVAELAKPLLGKELIMRYAQRQAAPAAQPPLRTNDATSADESTAGAAYSVVSREQKLRIVGISDLDPESIRGPTRAKVFLPLRLAESLHVMQPTDLREISRAASDQPVYSSISVRVKNPAQVQVVEDAIKKKGFTTFSLLDASQSLRSVFRVLYLFLLIFGSLALDSRIDRNCQHVGDGDSRAAARDRHHEGDRCQRRGRKEAFLRRGGRHGRFSAASWGSRSVGPSARSSTSAPTSISRASRFRQNISGRCRGGWLRWRLDSRSSSVWFPACIPLGAPPGSIPCRRCATSNPTRMIRAFRIVFLFLLIAGGSAAAQSRMDCSALNSQILKQVVHYCVYLPAGYDASAALHPAKRYPVLYFLHGLGDNEQTLFNGGGWTLLDDLRNQHKMGDFLIVCPEGRRSFYINSADGSVRYNDFFLQEFLPHIEGKYRILRGRAGRAISGISMGGYGALRFAFAHPELFSAVSAQSAALITESPQTLDSASRHRSASCRSAGPSVRQADQRASLE